MAVKEVDRGVQSLRDKQELMEAQATLARFSHAEPASQPHKVGAPPAAAAKQVGCVAPVVRSLAAVLSPQGKASVIGPPPCRDWVCVVYVQQGTLCFCWE